MRGTSVGMIVPGTIIPIRPGLWYSLCGVPRFRDGGFDLREEIAGGNTEDRSNVHELDDINPSLAVLILGDEGLWLAQGVSQLRLGQSFGLARFDEERLQQDLSGRAQGFLHSGRLSVDKGEPFR